jgi:hypothetical protein
MSKEINKEDKAFRNEYHLRVSISQIIAGSLYAEMELEDIIETIKEVLDDYLIEWKKELNNLAP